VATVHELIALGREIHLVGADVKSLGVHKTICAVTCTKSMDKTLNRRRNQYNNYHDFLKE